MWNVDVFFSIGPNMIENLMIVTTSASSVNVVFNVPAKPNGLITGYLISYNGMRNVSLKLFTTTNVISQQTLFFSHFENINQSIHLFHIFIHTDIPAIHMTIHSIWLFL